MNEATLEHARLALRDRPDGRAAMRQDWHDLLFLHWRVSPEAIQETLPAGLRVDTFEGSAWVGVVAVLHEERAAVVVAVGSGGLELFRIESADLRGRSGRSAGRVVL